MSRRYRLRDKGRRESGSFTAIPHAVQDSPNWRLCGHVALHLLLDLARQYNGRNNGDLCATISLLRPYGWSSNDTVGMALRELLHYGFIVLTRQGGLHAPSLYALTWRAIDDCGGKLEVQATTKPSGEWKQVRTKYRRPPKKKKPPRETVHNPSKSHRPPVHEAA